MSSLIMCCYGKCIFVKAINIMRNEGGLMDYKAIHASGGIGKPGKKKDCLDMRGLAMGKTNRKQRIYLLPRKNRSRSRCIIPGCNKPVGVY